MFLNGKRILITGGGSGIGLELARLLALRSEVVIAGRDEAKLERARSELRTVRTLRLDVTSEQEASGAVDWLAAELGGLDLLVNNAGVLGSYAFGSAEAARASVEEVDDNLTGSIRMTRLALRLLEQSREAGVVFMSSAVALAAVPQMPVYAATKAGLHSLARSLRAELEGTRIRVFEVLPPVVDTPFARGLDVPKLAPAAVAEAVVRGLERNREEIRIARVRQLALLARLAPRLADRVVARALTPSPSSG